MPAQVQAGSGVLADVLNATTSWPLWTVIVDQIVTSSAGSAAVGTGQRSSSGNGPARVGDGFLEQAEDRVLKRPSAAAAARLLSRPRMPPGNRTSRSVTSTPCLGKLVTGKQASIITGTGISFDARRGHRSASLPPNPSQLSLQRAQLGTRNADHICLNTHDRLLPRHSYNCKIAAPDAAKPSANDAVHPRQPVWAVMQDIEYADALRDQASSDWRRHFLIAPTPLAAAPKQPSSSR